MTHINLRTHPLFFTFFPLSFSFVRIYLNQVFYFMAIATLSPYCSHSYPLLNHKTACLCSPSSLARFALIKLKTWKCLVQQSTPPPPSLSLSLSHTHTHTHTHTHKLLKRQKATKKNFWGIYTRMNKKLPQPPL